MVEPARLGFIDPKAIDFGKRYREEYDLNDEFLDSIREKGIIQPITITQSGTQRPRLVSGGRRLTASLQLGLQQVPVLYRACEDELDLRECELFENLHRKNLRWDEDVLLVARIHELMFQKFGTKWSQRKTADLIDRSVGLISRKLELARSIEKLPDLRKEQSEDGAVKKLRKMVETLVVKDMVARHTAQAGGTESKVDSEPDKNSEGATQVQKKVPDDPRLEAALRASSHYRVGDAIAGLKEMEDKGLKPPTVLVEVDPPYGIDLKAQKKGGETRELNRYEEVDASEYSNFLYKLCRTLYNVTPENCCVIFWFGQEWYSTVRETLDECGFTVDPIPCVWVKPSGQTNNPDKYLARCYESFFVAWKGEGIPLQKRGRQNVFQFNAVAPAKKYHPTQRPVELMEEILNTFAWPGSIIMVPFLGSGTTLRAAYRQGMTGWGWDLNAENVPKFLAAVQEDIETVFTKPKVVPADVCKECWQLKKFCQCENPSTEEVEIEEDDSVGEPSDGPWCVTCGYGEDNCDCEQFEPDLED